VSCEDQPKVFLCIRLVKTFHPSKWLFDSSTSSDMSQFLKLCLRIGIHSSKSSRFCQIAILHHPWSSMAHGQAQNLWELHEAGSSMDFFKRTVAALAKGKPEDAMSSGSCGSGMWESLGNTMFDSKSRTTHAIRILDLS
jgi:hypothetical protein